jgi:amidase
MSEIELVDQVADDLRQIRDDLARCATDLTLSLTDDDLEECAKPLAGILDSLARVTTLQDAGVPLRHRRRDGGRQPTDIEDPCNAIIRFCEVEGADGGPLAGMRLGVKDNIAVAGVPMTGGFASDPAPIPSEDAVVVERLLDAGAVVTAKTNIAGSAFGDTRNPRNPDFSPGYSSSGSAAAVVAGIVDAALGTDIAGSVRIPPAWCGAVGMKATHGLIPNHGTIPSRFSLGGQSMNEIGPITSTVADSAALLETIAGHDWRDPESVEHSPAGTRYLRAAEDGINELRVGVVIESVDPDVCSSATLAAFARAVTALADLGAKVARVSVPLWRHASSIGLALLDMSSITSAADWPAGYYRYEARADESLVAALAADPSDVRERTRTRIIGEYVRRRGHGQSPHVRAQNLRLELRRHVDLALQDVELLVTPTMAVGPHPLADERLADPKAARDRLELHIRNTIPLNLTGHPALSVPSGPGDHELPTGLQIVGRRFDEYTVYRAAFALEAREDWPEA